MTEAMELTEVAGGVSETKWLESVRHLEHAKDKLFDVISLLAYAAGDVEEDPETYRIESLLNGAETLMDAVKKQIAKMDEGSD